MPNWCSTNVTIAKVDKTNPKATEALERFVKTFFDINEGKVFDIKGGTIKYYPNGFDGRGHWDVDAKRMIYDEEPKCFDWLGNFVLFYGLTDNDKLENHGGGEYRFRGSLTYSGAENFEDWKSYDQDYFQFEQEDAWGPNVLIWQDIIQMHYSDEEGNPLLRVFYQCEEPGMDIYYTNDDIGEYYDDSDVEAYFDADVTLENANEFDFCKREENSPFIKWNLNKLNERLKNSPDYDYSFNQYVETRYRREQPDGEIIRSYTDNIVMNITIRDRVNANCNESICEFANGIFRENIENNEQVNHIMDRINRDQCEHGSCYYKINSHEYCSIEDVDYKNEKR